MEGIDRVLRRASNVLNAVGGTALVFMMLLTVADVVGRIWGHPIIGTYEVVALSLAAVVDFTMPKVALDRKHVYMEIVIDKLSPTGRALMFTFTRLLCIMLFFLAGYNLLGVENEFRLSGEVSSSIRIPPEAQKVFADTSRDFIEKFAVGFNNIDIEGRDFFQKQGGKMVAISDAESAKWVKAVEPVVASFKKDMVSKGFKATEVDSWLSFIRERIEYWKGQEKARKIPTPFTY